MSADRCDICGEKFWFETDGPCGIGIVRAVHPPTPCVPKPPVVYESDDADEPVVRLPRKRGGISPKQLQRRCQWCEKPFQTVHQPRKTCSPKCWSERRAWCQQMAYQRRKERAA